ncbi:MAG TPA: hypothetical protein VI030_03590, partial [Propionibacteriaceae bacterium]
MAAVDGTVLVRGENTGLCPEHSHEAPTAFGRCRGNFPLASQLRTFLRRRTLGSRPNQACAGLL